MLYKNFSCHKTEYVIEYSIVRDELKIFEIIVDPIEKNVYRGLIKEITKEKDFDCFEIMTKQSEKEISCLLSDVLDSSDVICVGEWFQDEARDDI